MIIVVSDVHLGYQKPSAQRFRDFIRDVLEKKDGHITHLILLGDIFEFWRRFDEGVMFEHLDILSSLRKLDLKTYYVVGNHDYSLTQLSSYTGLDFEFADILCSKSDDASNRKFSQPPFGTIAVDSSLRSDTLDFRFVHGYQIEWCGWLRAYTKACSALCLAGDRTGGVFSKIWDLFQRFAGKQPPAEWKTMLKLSDLEKKALIESLWEFPAEAGTPAPKSRAVPYDKLVDREYLAEVLSEEHQKKAIVRELGFQTAPSKATDTKIIGELVDIWLHQVTQTKPKGSPKIDPKEARKLATASSKLRPEEFLVYGDTHDSPYVDRGSRVANSGHWTNGKGAYLEIDNGTVDAIPYP